MRYLNYVFTGCLLVGSGNALAEINVKVNPIYFLAGGADVDVEYVLDDGKTIGARAFYWGVEDFLVDDLTVNAYGITGSYYPSGEAYKGLFWAGELSYFDVDIIDNANFASGNGALATVKLGYSFRRGSFNMGYAIGASYYTAGTLIEFNLDGEAVGENDSFDGLRPHGDLTIGWIF